MSVTSVSILKQLNTLHEVEGIPIGPHYRNPAEQPAQDQTNIESGPTPQGANRTQKKRQPVRTRFDVVANHWMGATPSTPFIGGDFYCPR